MYTDLGCKVCQHFMRGCHVPFSAYIHTYIHCAYIHTYIRLHHIRCMYTHIHAYIPYMHAYIRTRIHGAGTPYKDLATSDACTHTIIHTHTYITYIHTYVMMQCNWHTDIHTYIHTCCRPQLACPSRISRHQILSSSARYVYVIMCMFISLCASICTHTHTFPVGMHQIQSSSARYIYVIMCTFMSVCVSICTHTHIPSEDASDSIFF